MPTSATQSPSPAPSPAPTPPPPPVVSPGRGEAFDGNFVDRQLRRTLRQMKWVDLGSALMTLSVITLASLLVLALVDHWVFDLGSFGRWLALIILVAGIGAYTLWTILPLLFRDINPMFAARSIEEGSPALKNSLLNFLYLRGDAPRLHRAVFQALEQRAAHDLASVPTELAVDRSQLVRTGYVLVGVMVLSAAYTILSPKSPFQTVRRVAAPWADVARPSRVEIRQLVPGHIEVYRGQTVEVSAVIRGVSRDGEPPRIILTSADGRIVGRAVDMRLDPAGLRHQGTLPGDTQGLQSDVRYHIEAGDAKSEEFEIRVLPAPHILVEQLEYAFPEYTRRAPLTILREGDIEAIEGTRVTIRARANSPIRSAQLETRRTRPDEPAEETRYPMEFSEERAWREIVLERPENERERGRLTYQLQYTTPSGDSSRDAVVHRIHVLPDLAPEIAILTPNRSLIEVPRNGAQPIEVRALDPDFGLRNIRLHAVAGGEDVLNEVLLESALGVEGQRVVSFEVRPTDLGLKVGDTLTYWAVAEDNREMPGSNSPAPNRVRTPRYQMVILPPMRIPDRPEVSEGENASRSGGESQTGESGEGQPDGGAGEGQSEGTESSSETEAGGSEAGESGEEGQGDSPSQPNDGGSRPADDADASNQPSSQSASAGENSQPSGDPSAADEEPLHDGEVVERVLEYLEEQQHASASDNSETAGHSASDRSEGEGSQNQEPADRRDAGSESSDASSSNGGAREPNQSPSVDQPEPGEGGSHEDKTSPAGDTADAGEGAAPPEQGLQEPGGPAGGGRPRADSAPTSSKEQQQRPDDKQPRPDPDQPEHGSDSSVSDSQQQSDTSSDSGGDQSGGGQQGAGQNANQAGNDSPGSQSESDQGAGQAASSGEGEVGPQAGNDQQSDGQTGQAGSESGEGSKTSPSGQGDSQGASDPDQPQTAPNRGDESTGGGGVSRGGGVPADTESPSSPPSGEIRKADAANLEYSRKATELVFEYLRDQERLDEDLLDELRWTKADRAAFVERWQQLKAAAREDENAARELDETLESLGLRPAVNTARTRSDPKDELRGLRQGGQSAAPPVQYQDQVEAFQRARARLE